MNNCTRLFLLVTPALIAIVLLGVAFSTHSWMITLNKYIPKENSLNATNDARVYSTLIPRIISRDLLTECTKYEKTMVLVSNSYDFREGVSREEQLKLANETCSNNQLPCRKGVAISRPLTRCFNVGQQCDGIIDCEDKSDESSCERTVQNAACRTGYTKCSDGKTCYRQQEQTCDGVSNCNDDSDEQYCNEEKCASNRHVYCPRENKCARRENSYRCDGIVDCEDNSDEENCQQCNGDLTVFLCDKKCFLPKYRCDGIVHCSDLRDELNCTDYSSTTNAQGDMFRLNYLCHEKRFNPFNYSPPTMDSSSLDSYPNPSQRLSYLNLMYYLQLITFYGVVIGLIFLFFAIISLFFFACCRRKCISAPFFFYGFWILLAWISICLALKAFVGMWFWKKQNLVDYENNGPFNIMIYQRNPSLQSIEFFGLSFWLACGAALATFIGLLLSCCICCTVGSSRSENKEYEIMHMQNY
ncbi:hypothetical protein I4U23_023824 [Adineta vaga]|nr:hypothetical protein I4U23_023824 [Adineta vaga]